MTGVPKCWNCGDADLFSTSRRIYCEKCNANLWYNMIPGQSHKFRPGSR